MNAAPMDTPAPQEPAWSKGRWALLILVAFAAHIGLIYALGSRKPIATRTVKNAPVILATQSLDERHWLEDPTLFALPHPRGYAGETWLRLPQIAIQPYRWTEPPRLLALPVDQLGEAFIAFARSNTPPRLRLQPLATVQYAEVEIPPSINTAQPSRLRVNEGLTSRKLMNAPAELPTWSAAEPLTNTLVRVMVDARGHVFSPVLIRPGSGSKDADQLALKIARQTRFASDASAGDALTRGLLIFEWQTNPKTNSLVAPR
jgi:hypothetical protein